jgi:hypothetical protein
VNALRPLQAVDADAARREAERILSDRRFERDPAPRPFRGPLRWVGERVEPIRDWIWDRLRSVPGRMWPAIVLAVVVFVVWRIVRAVRRRRVTHSGAKGVLYGDDELEDPNELERAADAAERDGDLERAIRLRFRAGLLRLGDRGAIRYRPSVTTSEVRRVLGSHQFDELARTFEAVTYGGRDPAPADVDAARREWPRVLDEAGRR